LAQLPLDAYRKAPDGCTASPVKPPSELTRGDPVTSASAPLPLSKLQAFAARLGWSFKWVSSGNNDFNYDYQVSFRPQDVAAGAASYNYASYRGTMPDLPGFSVFFQDAGDIFHSYSTYARGLDPMNSAYQLLDLVPRGRDEAGLPHAMAWLKFHDQYAT